MSPLLVLLLLLLPESSFSQTPFPTVPTPAPKTRVTGRAGGTTSGFYKPWETTTSTGSLDNNGVCHCSVVLPDSTFPASRLESLEISNRDMTIVLEKEITKFYTYEHTFTACLEQMKNLTKRVQVMETGGLSYTSLEFEMVLMEIREIEDLVTHLKTNMNGSNVVFETLFQEIHNMSTMVHELEVYDKNNVLVIRKEIETLKTRLKECEKDQTQQSQANILSKKYGTCNHGPITSISKPFVVQLNWAGADRRWGGWGRDSFLGAQQDPQWIAVLNNDARQMRTLRLYSTYNDLLRYRHNTEKAINNNFGQGSGMIVYNGLMFFNCFNSRDLCKLNMTTLAAERKSLPDASFNNRFSYSPAPWQDLDMSADEYGVYAMYSTEATGGNIVISKVNTSSLEAEQTWTTSIYKPAVTQAFMACGVLYATRALSTQREEIFYMYDTKTSTEGKLSVPFDKMLENVQNLHYNPNDQKLYMFNDGYEVLYDVDFMPLEDKKPQIEE